MCLSGVLCTGRDHSDGNPPLLGSVVDTVLPRASRSLTAHRCDYINGALVPAKGFSKKEVTVVSVVLTSAFQERRNRTGNGPDNGAMKGFYHEGKCLSQNSLAQKGGD